MNLTIRITGEIPPKKNSRIFNTKTRRCFPNKRYIEWHDIAAMEIMSQLPKDFKTIEKPVGLIVDLYHGDNKVRDDDNQLNSILDILKDIKIIRDDRWQYVPSKIIKNTLDRNNARCEITIYTTEE